MLKDFEVITTDLNNFEMNKVIPLVVRGIRNYVGKDNAITGAKIIQRMNESNLLGSYNLNPVKLRKIIQVIRLRGDIGYLCSSNKGYYLASNIQELDDCIESLEQRISQQELVVKSLVWQRRQYQN